MIGSDINILYFLVYRGVILYGMVVGKLPFSTHYTDQYRRQKLQQQIERGLVESHQREMALLTSGMHGMICGIYQYLAGHDSVSIIL